MKEEVLKYYNSIPENYKKTIEMLSSTILKANKNLSQDIRWKKLTFGLNEDFHHWICQLNYTKKAAVLYFHFGGLLEDKYKVFIIGDSKFLRKIEFKTVQDIDQEIITDYISQAIAKLDYFKNNWKRII